MSLKLNGATSGSIELDVPAAIGSDLSVTLPATAGEVAVKATDGSVDLGDVNIDSSGRLLVGTTTSQGINSGLQVVGDTGATIHRGNATAGNAPQLRFTRSRNTTYGSFTSVANGDELGKIAFAADDGTDYSTQAATIAAFVDAAPSANDMPSRLVFSVTADGASSPTERLRINRNGDIRALAIYTSTTAGAANVNVVSNGTLQRSTSSVKYKTDIEPIQDSYSDALLSCRPVWYRSTCEADNPAHGWWGFIAEEVAEIDPRLVHWKTVEVTYDENGSVVETPCDPEPEGVAYDRFVPHLMNLVKRQQQAIETLEAKVAALEANP